MEKYSITEWLVTHTSNMTVDQWNMLTAFEKTSLAYMIAIWTMGLFIVLFKR